MRVTVELYMRERLSGESERDYLNAAKAEAKRRVRHALHTDAGLRVAYSGSRCQHDD